MNKKVVENSVRIILQEIGDNYEREGLKATPARVARMYDNIFYGYNKTLKAMNEIERSKLKDKNIIPITTFKCDSSDMLIRNTKFISTCEHHMVPFAGTAWIGIIPGKKLLGMNKIDKIVKYFGAQLQIQERMTKQIADWIMDNIKPLGVIVIIKADHFCARLQGDDGDFTTSTVRGYFATDRNNCKEEFLKLIK